MPAMRAVLVGGAVAPLVLWALAVPTIGGALAPAAANDGLELPPWGFAWLTGT